MLGRSHLPRTGSFQSENLTRNVIGMIGNLCLTFFIIGVLIFTITVLTYEPEDPLINPPTRMTNFLESTTNPTFKSDNTVVRTGEDFVPPNYNAFATIINITDVVGDYETPNIECKSEVENKPIDCSDPEVFHVMMKAAIDHFKDVHFYKFGKAVGGFNDSSCHMAWRFRPKEGNIAGFNKDYRSFVISRSLNCSFRVVGIGEYHSGKNARKSKKHQKVVKRGGSDFVPMVGETVNDSLPVVESGESFGLGRYLVYTGNGDRCKSMSHYLWSFMCALGEAQYLNRTLVMDLSLCLSSIYSLSNQDEEGKDFRFYFDFEHLKESASVLDKDQFWLDWNKWHHKNGLSLDVVEGFMTTPMKLKSAKDTLILRKFGPVEPNNYWYRVCEGETESVVQRPWHLIWKSRRLMDIVSTISSRMNLDFDSIHVVRGDKAKNIELWPNLEADTSPNTLLSTLQRKIDDQRTLYIATNEPDTSFFNPLKDKYSIHFLDEYSDLWDENSEWYSEMAKLNKGVPVDFDGYMRVLVDTEVFLRGNKQIETFNDLARDCKDGVNTCSSAS